MKIIIKISTTVLLMIMCISISNSSKANMIIDSLDMKMMDFVDDLPVQFNINAFSPETIDKYIKEDGRINNYILEMNVQIEKEIEAEKKKTFIIKDYFLNENKQIDNKILVIG